MNHITEEEITRYYNRNMSQKEEMALLTHTCTCDYCAGRLAAAFPDEELITPPADLSQQILTSARRMEPRIVAARRKREFYLYCTKVVLAAGLAIAMLFGSGQVGNRLTEPPQNMELHQKQSISDGLQESSRNVGDFLNRISGKVTDRLIN